MAADAWHGDPPRDAAAKVGAALSSLWPLPSIAEAVAAAVVVVAGAAAVVMVVAAVAVVALDVAVTVVVVVLVVLVAVTELAAVVVVVEVAVVVLPALLEGRGLRTGNELVTGWG